MIDVGSFYLSALLFHAGLLASCIAAYVWWRAGDVTGSVLPVAGRLLAGAIAVLASMLPLAALATFLGARSGFTIIRLVSQGLFAELPALCIALAVADSRRRPTLAWFWAIACVGLLGAYWQGYHREPGDLHVRRHVVDLAVGANAHTLRILHLSDLQTDAVNGYVERVLLEARALEPDIVVWTGDYVQPRLKSDRLATEARLRSLLRSHPIPARLGSYAVRGDVDSLWPSPIEGTGIVPLSGQRVVIPLEGGHRLALVGLHSGTSRGQDVGALCRELGPDPGDDLRIAFGHNPGFVRLVERCGVVDVALAGHTHGGQVVLPLVGALITKSALPRRYASGLHAFGDVPLHVSAGIGMERGTAPQVRFGCPPEICLLEVWYGGDRSTPLRTASKR